MGEYRVRHAVANYHDADGKPRSGFRDQVVEIPDGEELDRLLSYDAVVRPEQELERLGTMVSLTASPSDQELLSWVLAASQAELEELRRTRPELAQRIRDAVQTVKEQASRADGLTRQFADIEPPDHGPVDDSTGPAQVQDGTAPADADVDGMAAADVPPFVRPADEVVAGNVDEVAAYLADFPSEANAILDAEARRAESKGTEPRAGVTKAAEAAAAHA